MRLCSSPAVRDYAVVPVFHCCLINVFPPYTYIRELSAEVRSIISYIVEASFVHRD